MDNIWWLGFIGMALFIVAVMLYILSPVANADKPPDDIEASASWCGDYSSDQIAAYWRKHADDGSRTPAPTTVSVNVRDVHTAIGLLEQWGSQRALATGTIYSPGPLTQQINDCILKLRAQS